MNDLGIAEASFSLSTAVLGVMKELGELKRVRSAGRPGSIAERLFADGWSRLLSGVPASEAMRGHVRASLTMMRLGDLDRAVLRDLELSEEEIERILGDAFDDAAAPLPVSLHTSLSEPCRPVAAVALPDFVGRLAAQPRAGVTCPGRPRLVFEPVENHAEHCAIVALYAVLVSPVFGADPVRAWLAAMAHHLHNALLPDAGFTGETLLGPHLDPVVRRARARGLAQLPRTIAEEVADALRILPDAGSADGRAFHAADTLDRVWQIEQHLRAGQVRLDAVLGEMSLVHEGPAKRFQEQVLRSAGIA